MLHNAMLKEMNIPLSQPGKKVPQNKAQYIASLSKGKGTHYVAYLPEEFSQYQFINYQLITDFSKKLRGWGGGAVNIKIIFICFSQRNKPFHHFRILIYLCRLTENDIFSVRFYIDNLLM